VSITLHPMSRYSGPGAMGRIVASLCLCLLGLCMLVVPPVADLVTGSGHVAIGYKQVIAGLVGLGVLASGVALSPHAGRVRLRYLALLGAVYLAGCAAALPELVPKDQSLLVPTWALLGYVVAACLLLPLRAGVPIFLGVLGLDTVLHWISEVKVSMTDLPLTMLDIKIATANPGGLWNALSLPDWTRYLAVAAGLMALLALVVGAGSAIHRFVSSGRLRRSWRGALVRLLVACFIGLSAASYLRSVCAEVAAEVTAEDSTWEPAGATSLSRKIGILPFLAYSYLLESTATGDYYRDDLGTNAPGPDEIRDAVLQYVNFEPARSRASHALPNIVILLAESTFDPRAVLRLTGDVNTGLFVRNERTAAVGPLIVNTVGGGTWISEFETIVGLDSRLFGYSGYYTHSSLALFIERSLATYLREKGYRTSAFFPHRGDFYNARRAYEHYGFERIFDSVDLGRDTGWRQTDVEVVNDFTKVMGPTPDAPFFSYVLLIENHFPHPCMSPKGYEFPVRLVGTDDFQSNCVLHEYLRRLDSTTAAFESLTDYLAGVEKKTGRPFVLAVFGDHQPHTFAGTGGVQDDFSPVRRTAAKNLTFFHIESTVKGRLHCCATPVPATLLPSLLSGYVAERPEDVYLGLNLWLFQQCGVDAVPAGQSDGLQAAMPQVADHRSDACRSAYVRALTGYRNAGIFRSAGESPPREPDGSAARVSAQPRTGNGSPGS